MAGKNRSARNATKHGILSQQVAFANPSEHEDIQQFSKLVADLMEEFEPVGTLEGLLVQQIAIAYWRLARVLKIEAREVAEACVQGDLTIKCERHLSSTGTYSPGELSELLQSVKLELSIHDRLSDVKLLRLGAAFGKGVQEIAALCNVIMTNGKNQGIGLDPES